MCRLTPAQLLLPVASFPVASFHLAVLAFQEHEFYVSNFRKLRSKSLMKFTDLIISASNSL